MIRSERLTISLHLFLFFFPLLAHALAPPHPSFTDYESVKQMRERLNITYHYAPQFLTDEQCRYINESTCQQMDEDLASAKYASQMQFSNGTRRRLNPSIGTFHVMVILGYFPEDAALYSSGGLPDTTFFNNLYNAKATSSVNPAGSISEFLRYNSLYHYNATFDIIDWQPIANSQASYAAGVSGRRDPLTMAQVFIGILEAMDNRGFDFSKYDSDNDGLLDHLMVVHSGVPAELGNPTCTSDYLNRIWSQAVATTNGAWTSKDGKYSLNGYTLSGAWTYPNCSTPTTMAIPQHEFMHGFNLVDLYDFDQDEGKTGIAGVGSFDLMCNAYGWANDGAHPPYLSPYSKREANWVSYTEITEPGFYTLQPSELASQVYVIRHGFPDSEYLLIENRFAIKWESDWTGKGVVIYHVDDLAPLQSNRGYPGHSNWPAEHYRLAVLQADGNYDIEKLVNLGDSTDFFVKDDVLGPGPNTWPNTDSYQSGQVATGVTIRVTTSPSFIMQIQVTW